jgi:hypothetical protein
LVYGVSSFFTTICSGQGHGVTLARLCWAGIIINIKQSSQAWAHAIDAKRPYMLDTQAWQGNLKHPGSGNPAPPTPSGSKHFAIV